MKRTLISLGMFFLAFNLFGQNKENNNTYTLSVIDSLNFAKNMVNQETSNTITTWQCPKYAYQYQIIVKTRTFPNFPGDLGERILKNQHPTEKVVIPLGTEVDLLIYPRNSKINTNLLEVSYESH